MPTALGGREARITELVGWAKGQDFAKLQTYEIFQKIRLHAMSEFYISGKKANEYAEVVMDKLDLNGKEEWPLS
jgi:hypothetical protein